MNGDASNNIATLESTPFAGSMSLRAHCRTRLKTVESHVIVPTSTPSNVARAPKTKINIDAIPGDGGRVRWDGDERKDPSAVRRPHQIDVLLRILRDGETPPTPIRVEITNANELAPAGKVMTIKRNDSGKMTGAVVESVPDPT